MLQQCCSMNKEGLHFPTRSMGNGHGIFVRFGTRSQRGRILETSFCNPTFFFWTGARPSRVSSKGTFSCFAPLDGCSSGLTRMFHRLVSQSHVLSFVCSRFRTFLVGSNPTWTYGFVRFFSTLNSTSPSTATGSVPLLRVFVALLASLGRRSTGRIDLLGPPFEFDVHRGASKPTSLSRSPIVRKGERERSRFPTRGEREWRNSGEIGDEWTNPKALRKMGRATGSTEKDIPDLRAVRGHIAQRITSVPPPIPGWYALLLGWVETHPVTFPPGTGGGWRRPPPASFSHDTETDRHKILHPFLGRVRTTCPGGRRCALVSFVPFPPDGIDPTTTRIVQSRGSEEILLEDKRNDRSFPTGAKSISPRTIRARLVPKQRKCNEKVRFETEWNGIGRSAKKIQSNHNERVRM